MISTQAFNREVPKKLVRPFTLAFGAALSGPGVGGRNKNTFRLGASLVDGNIPVIAGHNSYKTHPALAKLSEYPFQHAESACFIRHGLDNCKGLSLFVVRVDRRGFIANAKPCDTCTSLATEIGIKDMYYTTNKGFEYAEFKNINRQ